MSSLHFHFCPCIFIFVLAFSFLSLHFHKNIKNHFVSYEYFRIVIWHGLKFEHFKNLENLKNLDHWVFWTFWELTCSFRSILSSDLGLDSFESCSQNPFLQLFIRHYKNCPDGFNYLPKRKLGTKYWRMRIFAEKRRFICCTCPVLVLNLALGFGWLLLNYLLKVKSLNLRYWLGIWSDYGQQRKIPSWFGFWRNGILLPKLYANIVLSWPWPWD